RSTGLRCTNNFRRVRWPGIQCQRKGDRGELRDPVGFLWLEFRRPHIACCQDGRNVKFCPSGALMPSSGNQQHWTAGAFHSAVVASPIWQDQNDDPPVASGGFGSTSDRRRVGCNGRSLTGQDPPVALIKCLPRSGRSTLRPRG